MNKALSVVRLESNRRLQTFGTPLFVQAGMLLVLLIVFGALNRFGEGTPAGPNGELGPIQANVFGIACGMLSVMIVLGAQSMAINFPLTRAFGIGVRSLVWGTYGYYLLVGAYFTVITVAMYTVEGWTGGWFIDVALFRLLDFGGNLGTLILAVGVGALFGLGLGGAFGAVWLRYGSAGLWVGLLGLLFLLGGILWVIAPVFVDVMQELTQARVLVSMAVLSAVFAVATGLLARGMAYRSA